MQTFFFFYVGEALYVIGETISSVISNNSVILSDSTGRIPRLQCITGAAIPNSGHWISPSGLNLNNVTDDPFSVIIGDWMDPGYIEMKLEHNKVIGITDTGIYTCLVPNEDGDNATFYVGLYHNSYPSKLGIPLINQNLCLWYNYFLTITPSVVSLQLLFM